MIDLHILPLLEVVRDLVLDSECRQVLYCHYSPLTLDHVVSDGQFFSDLLFVHDCQNVRVDDLGLQLPLHKG